MMEFTLPHALLIDLRALCIRFELLGSRLGTHNASVKVVIVSKQAPA